MESIAHKGMHERDKFCKEFLQSHENSGNTWGCAGMQARKWTHERELFSQLTYFVWACPVIDHADIKKYHSETQSNYILNKILGHGSTERWD